MLLWLFVAYYYDIPGRFFSKYSAHICMSGQYWGYMKDNSSGLNIAMVANIIIIFPNTREKARDQYHQSDLL